MADYRYTLEPYQGPSSRYTCPKCQQHRQFVRYVDMRTGQHLNERVGRCNREINCGYHYNPKQYFTDNNISQTLFLYTQSRKIKQRYRHGGKPLEPDYIDRALFERSLQDYAQNHFIQYLTKLLGPAQTQQLIARFFLGSSKHWPGATLFWQIDLQGRVRTGKIMLYNAEDGKRVKKPFSHIYWAHKKVNKASFRLEQCLFGLHQLASASEGQPVGLVESEKTAVLATAYFPAWIWLATGSIHQLQARRCAALAGRRVVLFPDVGGWSCWSAQARTLEKALKGPVLVSDWLEQAASQEMRHQGGDLADYLIAAKALH